jgi:hypothetical protein
MWLLPFGALYLWLSLKYEKQIARCPYAYAYAYPHTPIPTPTPSAQRSIHRQVHEAIPQVAGPAQPEAAAGAQGDEMDR